MKETFEVPELCCSAIEVYENFHTGFRWIETGSLHWSWNIYLGRRETLIFQSVRQICLGQNSSIMVICVGVCASGSLHVHKCLPCNVLTPYWVLHTAWCHRLNKVMGHHSWVGVCSADRTRNTDVSFPTWSRDQPLESAQHELKLLVVVPSLQWELVWYPCLMCLYGTVAQENEILISYQPELLPLGIVRHWNRLLREAVVTIYGDIWKTCRYVA